MDPPSEVPTTHHNDAEDVRDERRAGGGGVSEERGERQEEVDSSTPASRPVVGIDLCGSTPLLFRSADVKAVRDAGLVGTLVGSLPRQPRQNCRLGRPLQLMQEEVRLLTETGGARLLPPGDEGGIGDARHQELVVQYEEEQQRSFEEQSVLALDDRKSALLRAMTDTQRGGDSGGQTTDQALRDRLEALDHSFTFPRSAMAVQLSTARAGLAHGPEERSFLKASWPTRPQENQRSESHFRVFRDLRQRGFYLTSAGKFGGDYLVYPGDPLRFHAHFIAVCLSMEESVPLCDILAVARLGSNVKKTVVLCSPGPGQDRVVYTSLQWSGMV
ncbi:tRNA-splicing endonuclease subunit Sen34 [Polymixia lowei]